MEIPVKVLPDEPERIAVQWDAQQASIAAAGGDMAAVTAGLQSTYSGAADAAMRQAQANAAAEDPAAKLEKLGQMRDSGLITPAGVRGEEEGDPRPRCRRRHVPKLRPVDPPCSATSSPSAARVRGCAFPTIVTRVPAPSSSKRAVRRKTLVMKPLKRRANPSVQNTRIFCGQSMYRASHVSELNDSSVSS